MPRASPKPPPVRFAAPLKDENCCVTCADGKQSSQHDKAIHRTPTLVQPKLAAPPRIIQRAMMSDNTKSDMLPMMTRSTYDKAEASLNRQGLSLENVIDKSRMSIKPQRGACANYPGVYNANINGVMHAVPYDWAHWYACFDPFLHPFVGQVNIVYTGGRNGDYAAANLAAGLGATPANYTWHHFENYNAGNNQGTMQLVLTAAHQAVFHVGGVWQWVAANGGFYGP
jgi:hypothetical protein